jgi:hypothetical protein
MSENAKNILDISLTPFEGCASVLIRCKHYGTWRKFPHTIFLLDDAKDFRRLVNNSEDQLMVINMGLRYLQEQQIMAHDMELANDDSDY